MALRENPLKNAYIGEVYEKSLNLKGKTVAQIQAEGWSFNNWRGNYTLDSNGLSVSASNSSVTLYFDVPKSLTTSSRITVKATGYCTVPGSGSYGGIMSCGVFNAVGSGYYSNCISGNYSSGDNASGGVTGIVFNNSRLSASGPQRVAGNISYTATMDLSTGECSMSMTGPSSYTGTATLTSSQISSILNYGKACAVIEEYTNGYTMRLEEVTITIGY